MVDKILIVEIVENNMMVHSIYEIISAARIAFNENFSGECNEITQKHCRAGEYRIVSVREYLDEKLKVETIKLLNELKQLEEAQNQYDLIIAERGYCTLPSRHFGKEVTVNEFLE